MTQLKINFFGAPCSGKTSAAQLLYNKLMKAGLDVALVKEYATDFFNISTDLLWVPETIQMLFWSQQVKRFNDVFNYEIVIQECPEMLCRFYVGVDPPVRSRSGEEVISIFLIKEHHEEAKHRIHDEEQSYQIEKDLKEWLYKCDYELTLEEFKKDVWKFEDLILNKVLRGKSHE